MASAVIATARIKRLANAEARNTSFALQSIASQTRVAAITGRQLRPRRTSIMQVPGADLSLRHALAAVAYSQATSSSEATLSSIHPPDLDEEQRLAERTVMCYGIPWDKDPDEAEEWLACQCSKLKDEISHIQLRRFGEDKSLEAQYPANSKHTGYAHIAVRSTTSMSALIDLLTDREMDGRVIKALPASETRKLLPPGWFATVGYLEGGEEWVEQQKILAAERERRHAIQLKHNRNRRRRRKEQHADEVKAVVEMIRNPFTGKVLSESSHSPLLGETGSACYENLDWENIWNEMPAPCDPARGGRLCKASMSAASIKPTATRKRNVQKQQKLMEKSSNDSVGGPIRLDGVSARAERKRVQVASFAIILRQILGGWQDDERSKAAMIVDFGCGSGNLLLPLAVLFPRCTFLGVDMKPVSIALLNERAADSGLENVSGIVGNIENFEGTFDAALGLHACGMATDHAMDKAIACSAAYIMCPCCVGKLKFGLQKRDTTVVLSNAAQDSKPQSSRRNSSDDEGCVRGGPRSAWLRDSIGLDQFATLATAADLSHADGHGYYEWAEQAKTCIELDRNKAAHDAGYNTAITKLLGVDEDHFVNKSDILVGLPRSRVKSGEFEWVWGSQM